MTNYDTLLAQLMASRLNHDYVAPLTAISNSCELMQISPESQEECVALIGETIESSINLLQFYRLSFGPAAAAEVFSNAELERLLRHMTNEQATNLELRLSGKGMPRMDAKMIALAFLCVRSSFTKLNALQIEERPSGWHFGAQGVGAISEDTGAVRCEAEWHQTAEPTAGNVHFPIFLSLIEGQRYELSRKVSEGDLSLEIWRQ